MMYIDEAAYIPRQHMDDFFQSMYPTMVSGENPTKLILASSTNGYNHFCHLWYAAMCNYNNLRPVKLPYTLMSERNGAWAEEEKHRIGEDVFRQEYLCEFVDDAKYDFSGGGSY